MILIFAPIIFGVVVCLAWRSRDVRGCRWRESRIGDKGSLRMYRCVACGAEAFTATKGPPLSCKKGLSRSSL